MTASGVDAAEEWAWVELNYRPHAYQATKPGASPRQLVCTRFMVSRARRSHGGGEPSAVPSDGYEGPAAVVNVNVRLAGYRSSPKEKASLNWWGASGRRFSEPDHLTQAGPGFGVDGE